MQQTRRHFPGNKHSTFGEQGWLVSRTGIACTRKSSGLPTAFLQKKQLSNRLKKRNHYAQQTYPSISIYEIRTNWKNWCLFPEYHSQFVQKYKKRSMPLSNTCSTRRWRFSIRKASTSIPCIAVRRIPESPTSMPYRGNTGSMMGSTSWNTH